MGINKRQILRILVADQHLIFRAGIKALLVQWAGLKHVTPKEKRPSLSREALVARTGRFSNRFLADLLSVSSLNI